MRQLRIMCLGLMSAVFTGCGMFDGPQYINQPISVIPAHTQRHYAELSLPAYAADGSYYVAEGDRLRHYAADGAVLEPVMLTGDAVPAGDDPNWCRIAATRGGTLFINLPRAKLGVLDSSGQVTWFPEDPQSEGYMTVLGEGVLIQRKAGASTEVAFVGPDGAIRWSQPGTYLSALNFVAIDDQARVCFSIYGQLIIRGEDGAVQAQFAIPGQNYISVLAFRNGRLLVAANDSVSCLDLDGGTLWQAPRSDGESSVAAGMLCDQNRAVLQYDVWTAYSNKLNFIDAQGRLLRQMRDEHRWALLDFDGSKVLAAEYNVYDPVLRAIDTSGEVLWSQPLEPQPSAQPITAGAIVPEVGSFITAAFAPDGSVYYGLHSSLWKLDNTGHLLWQEASTVYFDRQVPELHYW